MNVHFLVLKFRTSSTIKALEDFNNEAVLPDDSKENEALFDKKVGDIEALLLKHFSCFLTLFFLFAYLQSADLERTIDSSLQVLYLRQLGLARERAMSLFKQLALKPDTTELNAIVQVISTIAVA